MTRKSVSIRIDAELYDYAKTTVPSISQSFEEFLKILLNDIDTDQLQLEMQLHNIQEEIRQLNYEKAMIESKLKYLKDNYDNTKAEKEMIWSKMRQEITRRSSDRKWRYMNQDIVKEAEEKLGYNWRELVKIHEFVQRNLNNFEFPTEYANYWEYIEPAWRETRE